MVTPNQTIIYFIRTYGSENPVIRFSGLRHGPVLVNLVSKLHLRVSQTMQSSPKPNRERQIYIYIYRERDTDRQSDR